jgi:hypothetical protein
VCIENRTFSKKAGDEKFAWKKQKFQKNEIVEAKKQ